MKDLKNAFPYAPVTFHNKINQTLNKLIEEEAHQNMKKHKLFSKKILVLVAAAILVIGTGVFAAGKITTYVSSSSNIPTYTSVPSDKELQHKYGFAPNVVDTFTNGYQFAGIYTDNNKGLDEDGKTVKESKDVTIDYKNGKESIMLSAQARAIDDDTDMATVDTYKGTAIQYSAYDNKCVPPDYKFTEQDKQDEKSGKYVFSCGTDKVEISKVQSLTWYQNGITYIFTGIDSPLSKGDLVTMAHEVMDTK